MTKRRPKEPALLRRLRDADREVPRLFPNDGFYKGLGIVGFILYKTLERSVYDWCAPMNSWAFADTGGDGVHFSLLERAGAIRENSPVVVQPADMGLSWIVGEDLYDFLSFGARRGFRPFETIGLDWRASFLAQAVGSQRSRQADFGFPHKKIRLTPWA